jgi:uncharacterized damage-inducible protein DinB
MSLIKKIGLSALLVSLAASTFAVAAARADDAAMPGGARGEMLMWIKDAEDKLVQLAEATPEGKYTWRPSKDVRTTGEVFLHVAAANFGVPGFAGIAPPEGFKFDGYEKSMSKKADIVNALKGSFAHMEKGFTDMSDADMEKPVELFGMKTTARGAYMLLLSHVHEHLGQSIAYARSNGIVPPWTAKAQAQAKAKAEADKAKEAAASSEK